MYRNNLKHIKWSAVVLICVLIIVSGCGQAKSAGDSSAEVSGSNAGDMSGQFISDTKQDSEAGGETVSGAGTEAGGETVSGAGTEAADETVSGAGTEAGGETVSDAGSDTDSSTGSGSSSDAGAGTSEKKLPAYVYPGVDPLYRTICAYIISEFGSQFDAEDLGVPCPIIVDIDESNPEDIRVSGEFWYQNYDLQGESLCMISGGSFPGMLHLRKTDSDGETGYEVTGADLVADGSDSDESAQEIFGVNYDAYIALGTFISVRELMQIQMLEDYLQQNQVLVTKVQADEWKSIDLLQKAATLSSADQLNFSDVDGSGQNFAFTYNGESFTAQYTEDNWKILDSWRIQNTGDMEQICEALLEIHEIPGNNGNMARTARDMAFEWMQHNFAYEHLPEEHPWRQNAKDVDLDPKDQGKTFIEIYEARAGERFRTADFIGDTSEYLQLLQEIDFE